MPDVVNAIFNVFDCISEWIITQISVIPEIFWTPVSGGDGGSLTFLGTLAVCSLGIGVVFLLIRVVQNFLHFRG